MEVQRWLCIDRSGSLGPQPVRRGPALLGGGRSVPRAASRDEPHVDDFARGFGVGLPARFGGSGGWPHVEVSETDSEVKVVAELPGLEERDIDLSLQDGVLTLKGEKKSETEGAFYSERWHGQFQRSLQVGPDVDPDKVSASFKNGVLTITLAKRPEAQRQAKRIPISGG
jgi:HSP20 family protein